MKRFYPIVVIVFALFSSTILYHHFNPKSAKSKRLVCHQESTTFERLYEPHQTNTIQTLLKSGDFSFTINIAKSSYMPTRIDSYMKQEAFEVLLHDTFGKPRGEKLRIDLLLYENDKKDPKKKTQEAKLYEGYVQVSFYLNHTRVYTVQLDYMDPMGNDIAKRLKCALESVESL